MTNIKLPTDQLIFECKLCGKDCTAATFMLHVIARHWEWINALHNHQDLTRLAEEKGV